MGFLLNIIGNRISNMVFRFEGLNDRLPFHVMLKYLVQLH
jgi:hypothetical protein